MDSHININGTGTTGATGTTGTTAMVVRILDNLIGLACGMLWKFWCFAEMGATNLIYVLFY